MIASVAIFISAIKKPLCYVVPTSQESSVAIGQRVCVPLGSRFITGIIVGLNNNDADEFKLRSIEHIIDKDPIISPKQIQLCEFIAKYYACDLSLALKLCLPPNFTKKMVIHYKLSDGSHINGIKKDILYSKEQLLSVNLTDKEIKILLKKGALLKQVKEKKQQFSTEKWLIPINKDIIIDEKKKSIYDFNQWLNKQAVPVSYNLAKENIKNIPYKLKCLQDLNKVKIMETAKIPYFKSSIDTKNQSEIILNEEQKQAVDKISTAKLNERFLLEGITGSGKTIVYLSIAKKHLQNNKNIIIIVPEISLTPQLLSRIQQVLKVNVAVLHSALSGKQRNDIIHALAKNQFSVLLGARSAIFAPMPNLGLIIVDEEHDASYKQDISPRYHARDVALYRAKNENAQIILCSATVSLEMRLLTLQKKITHLKLSKRAGGSKLPQINIVDLKSRAQILSQKRQERAISDGQKLTIISTPLRKAIESSLANNNQVMLLLNKRGYSAFALCDSCGELLMCPHCSVSMTYHLTKNILKCHYCSYKIAIVKDCPACKSPSIICLGLGTQRLQTELQLLFPGAKIARLDRDVAQKNQQFEDIMNDMHDKRIDILLGTQMIAKGHDFAGVDLVGIISADSSLSMPDIRAAEKTFQLITQMSGRCGRGDKPGQVFIQTFNPKNPVIVFAKNHDIDGFTKYELEQRKNFMEPPFYKAAIIRLQGKSDNKVRQMADTCCDLLKDIIKELSLINHSIIFGPSPSPLEKIKDNYRYQIYLKTKNYQSRGKIINKLLAVESFDKILAKNYCKMMIDIDPISML